MIHKIRVIQLIAILLLACGSAALNGQTGPAGIGNTTGTNGHPHNLVWLDATDLSGFVTGDSWLDKSGNDHHAVSDGANLFLGNINGKTALDFSTFDNGNFAIAHHSDFDDVSQLSIFVVYNSGSSTKPQGLVSKRTGTGIISFSLYQHTAHRLYADYIIDDYRIDGANNTSQTDYIGNYIFQTNDSIKIYKNGILDGDAWRLTGSGNTNNTGVNIEIGKLDQDYHRNNNFKGKIAEIIIYKTNLSPIQRALVISYLSSKYGIGVQEANLTYSPSDDTFYDNLTGFARSSAGFKGFGPSDGLYISLNDAAIGDYITAAHNGALNDIENIQTGADVTASGAIAAWNRDWYVEKGGLSTAKISFSFPEGFDEGSFPQELSNYVLLRKDSPEGTYSQVNLADKGVELGERVWFEVADANFEDGYYTLGTLDQSASPLEGGSTRTWYSLISGDWDNWEVWTLDPSGALPNNPNQYTPSTSPTAASDKVVVLNGKTVTISTNDKIHQQVSVDGRLDLQGTSGHDFGQIRGRGRILLKADHFPAGDATHFSSVGQGEGTVVYYGSGFELTQNLVFFNLEVDLASASDLITLLNDLTINGEFRVKNGEFQFNNDVATNDLNVTVHGHVVVEANGKLLTGTANARHQFNLYGDFTNNGSVAFTNRATAIYNSEATDGIVDVNFLNGSKNQLAFFNGPSKMYRIEIDKGTDATYELILEATHVDHFQLLGLANQGHSETAQLTSNSNALGLLRGTVRVKSNINIPVLNNTGNYNISELARLWVDGGYVAKTSGTAIVPYGVIQVSSGTLESLVHSGITTRGNALVKVEGGTLNMNQLRTSVFGSENVGGYVQSGGVVNVLGGNTNSDYYCFNLTYPGNVFNMSGGTLHIHEANSKGGVFIASDPVNQNVTGGTVIFDIKNTSDFAITSKAPFWNLIIRKTSTGTGKHILAGGVDVGSDNVNLDAQILKVLNDFTIESDSWLDANNQDVSIGRNFTIQDNALYEFHENTTTFNGTEDATLYIGDITALTNPSYNDPEGASAYADWEHPFYKLVINKPSDKTLFFASKNPDYNNNTSNVKTPAGGKNIYDWRSNLVKVIDAFELLSGKVDLALFSLRLYGDITNYGILAVDAEPTNAIVRTRKEAVASTRMVKTTNNAYFGNLRLNSDNTIFQFTSDVYIGRMEYKHGRLNISKYNLKIDDLVIGFENEASFDFDGSGGISSNERKKFSVADMIITDGNASDGGLSLLVNSNKTYYFPIGVGTDATELARNNSKFTPVELGISSCPSSGYVTIRPVDAPLQTTNLSGGSVLDFYWRISCSGFTTNPVFSNIYMLADDRDIPSGAFPADFYSGWVEDDKDANANGFNYDRFYEALDDVNLTRAFNNYTYNTDKWIRFNNTGADVPPTKTLVGGNFTAGVSSRFTGEPTVYYSIATDINNCNWNSGANWARNDNLNASYGNHDSRQTAAGDYPQAGDIAVIGWCPWDDGNSNIDAGDPHLIRLTTDIECAQLIFTPMEDISGNPRAREARYASVFRPCLGIYNGKNLTTGLVKGEGMFWCKGSDPDFSLMDLGEFAVSDSSYILYENYDNSRTYANIPTESPNLIITSDNWGKNNRTTIIGTDIKTNGSFEIIGNANVQLDTDADGDITIGGNLVIFEVTDPDAGTASGGGGEIRFQNSGSPRSISVKGDILLNNTSNKIYVQNAATNNIAHQIKVSGNISQTKPGDGLLFFSSAGNDHIDLILNGNNSKSFNITAGNMPEFHRIIIDKGTDQNSSFTFNGDFNLNGPTSGAGVTKALELKNGTLILNNIGIDFSLTDGNEDFFIPGTAALEVRQGQVTASGNSGILLDGQLIVSGGTVDMSGGNNYIQYSASGNAAINVSAGDLIVGSQIRRGLTSSEGILDYTQSGGTVIVGNNAAPENNRGVFEVMNAGSNFSFTGGELQIARAQDNPTFASVFLDPESVTTSDAALFRIGNDNTPVNQTIGFYSNIGIPNLLISNSGTNGPTLSLWTVPLTVSNLLQVEAGAGFDADGNDLILKGDFLSAGDFMPNGNTTIFSGAGDQEMTGDLTFFNLTKSSPGELRLNNSISIQNRFRHEDGFLVDNSHVVSVGGSLYMYGDHEWGGSGRGIVLNGIEQQMLYGSGSFGKLTTNNPEGIKVDDGNTVYINRALQMEQGVLNVGSNLLVLAEEALIIEENPFSAFNMIQTNISFTDNGVKKFLPSGAGNFIFPVGSGGKYTPVKLNITANNNGSGSLLVKPAGEAHPSVLDVNNVLNYHWVVRADGLSGFAAEARMKYDIGDVKGNISNYITARLLSDGSGEWNKFSGDEVIDEANRELVFSFFSTDDAGISGDYTAGLDAAIPNQVPTYITITDGLWNNSAIWDTYPVAGGSVPESGPRGSMVVVSHAVEMPGNYTSSYRTTIAENGVLSIGSTFGHRLGEVFGSGVLSLESGDMPAGFYDAFLEESGGTLRFGGITSYDILSTIHQLNNLELTGSGTRRFPNIDVQLTGDLLIDGPQARNEQNRRISVKGDVVFESGSFVAGNGESSVFVLNGSATQTLSGLAGFSGSNSFNKLTVNNPAGVVFALDADVKDVLTLSAGRIIVNETAQFRIDNYNAGAIVNASATRYIDGPLYKRINSGASFEFPLGNESRYGIVRLANVSAEGLWRAQYHSSTPSGAGLSTGSKEAPVQYVSTNEYWNIEAPTVATAEVTLRWDASSGVNPAESGMRGVQWLTDKWHVITLSNIIGTSTSGTARTSPALSFNANSGGNYITFGAITIPSYTWTGATGTDWFTAGNWTNNTVPSASANTTIGAATNLPEISGVSVAQVNDLMIETGATLTLNPGGKLTVNGNLIVADAGGLVMNHQVGAGGMASLLTHGTISGQANIQLTLPKERWFYLGSSVKDSKFGIFDPSEDTKALINVYRDRWYGIRAKHIGTAMQQLEGVTAYYFDYDGTTEKLLSYNGELNNGDISRTYAEDRYQLFANPYPSFINWENAEGWDRANVEGTMWYRTKVGEEMTFITYNKDAIAGAKVAVYPNEEYRNEDELSLIAPMQAVFVKPIGSGVNLTIKNGARTHGITESFLKSSSGKRTGDVIRIEQENDYSRDGAVIYFASGSEEEYDKGDSEKYFNDSEQIPEIFTRVGDQALSINGLPILNDAAWTIPLSVRNRIAGEVTMKFDLSYYYGQHAPYLEDRETGVLINLLQENSYTYTVSETGENHDRFVLNFYYVTTDLETPAEDETYAGSSINIKSLAGKVLVSVGMDLLKEGKGTVSIYTIEGRKVTEIPAYSSRTLVILPDQKGIYIIRAKFGNQIKSERVIGSTNGN